MVHRASDVDRSTVYSQRFRQDGNSHFFCAWKFIGDFSVVHFLELPWLRLQISLLSRPSRRFASPPTRTWRGRPPSSSSRAAG